MLTYMNQHTDAWQGVTYWSGGPWWPPDYMFSIEPLNGVDRPQMALLVDHLSSIGFSPQDAGTIVYAAEYGVAPSATELNVLNQFTTAQYAYGQQIGVMDPAIMPISSWSRSLPQLRTSKIASDRPIRPIPPRPVAMRNLPLTLI